MEGDRRKKEEKKNGNRARTRSDPKKGEAEEEWKEKKNGRRRGEKKSWVLRVGEAFVPTSMIHSILKYYFNIFIYLICFILIKIFDLSNKLIINSLF